MSSGQLTVCSIAIADPRRRIGVVFEIDLWLISKVIHVEACDVIGFAS